jgi:effector-binding domain-containing protein
VIDAPHIVEVSTRPAATIHLAVRGDEMKTVMGPAMREVMAALAEQGLRADGPMFAHHLQVPGDRFDFEVGVPVAAPVKPLGRVMPSRLPAGRIARTVYRGPYEGLGEAWGRFMKWIDAQGLKPGPTLWESYRVGPESGTDASQWQTELSRPLLD